MFEKMMNALVPAHSAEVAKRSSTSSVARLRQDIDMFDAITARSEAECRALVASAKAKVKKTLAPQLIEALMVAEEGDIEAIEISALEKKFANKKRLDQLQREETLYDLAKQFGVSSEDAEILLSKLKNRSEY